MKRPFLVASDLRPCVPVDETQQRNGDSTDWDKLDVILRAYRYAMILAERKGELLRTDETKATSQEVTFVH
ncbi:hypothetical protein PD716_06395 [Vibrio gigantis]|uniref:hypothetical protein n=1 Tax=Vibrio gigantis TaxID=296199 RepID=UPI002FCC1A7C